MSVARFFSVHFFVLVFSLQFQVAAVYAQGALSRGPGATLGAAFGVGENAEAEGLCSEEDKQEFARQIARLEGCPCISVKVAAKKAYEKFLEGCEQTQAAMEIAGGVSGDLDGVAGRVKQSTFSSGDVSGQRGSQESMQKHIEALEESIKTFEEAKSSAEDAAKRLKLCPDPVGHLLDAPDKMKEIIDRVLQKIEESIESAKGLLGALESSAGGSEGFAESAPEAPSEGGESEGARQPAEQAPDWIAPEEDLMPWANGGGVPDPNASGNDSVGGAGL